MRYVSQSVGSAFIPKILGTYERELQPYVVEGLHHRKVIDIGAAEGYYAVGMALLSPEAKVIAYEVRPDGQSAIRQMAKQNQVGGRLDIRGKCERSDLHSDLDGSSAFVICDCEGYEIILLDPLRIPRLTAATILVETHDFLIRGISDELSNRFAATHTITRVWQTDRTTADYPYSTWYTRLLPKSYLVQAAGEWRPERMSWLWMVPKGDHPLPERP